MSSLDLQAIVAIAETATFMKVVSSNDPSRDLRIHRNANPRVTGISMTLYTTNEVVAGRIIARALEMLERTGVRRDARWVGCTSELIEKIIRDAAASIGCQIISPEERLRMGLKKLEREASRT